MRCPAEHSRWGPRAEAKSTLQQNRSRQYIQPPSYASSGISPGENGLRSSSARPPEAASCLHRNTSPNVLKPAHPAPLPAPRCRRRCAHRACQHLPLPALPQACWPCRADTVRAACRRSPPSAPAPKIARRPSGQAGALHAARVGLRPSSLLGYPTLCGPARGPCRAANTGARHCAAHAHCPTRTAAAAPDHAGPAARPPACAAAGPAAGRSRCRTPRPPSHTRRAAAGAAPGAAPAARAPSHARAAAAR